MNCIFATTKAAVITTTVISLIYSVAPMAYASDDQTAPAAKTDIKPSENAKQEIKSSSAQVVRQKANSKHQADSKPDSKRVTLTAANSETENDRSNPAAVMENNKR